MSLDQIAKKVDLIVERKDKVIYREGDKLIKLFGDSYSKSDILNEALNQARVEETGLAIPNLREVSLIEGRWAIVMDFIEGKTLEELIEENPDKKDEYLEKFVDLQITVHEKNSPLLNVHHVKMRRKISETDLDATMRYELNMRLEGMPKHHKVCHGDFNPSNIIIDSAGKPYIIDWSHVTQGNASADVARTYLLFYLKGKEEVANEYMKLFSKKTDTAIQYIQKWIPIVAASQLVKKKAEEREFLLNWIDVVEYE